VNPNAFAWLALGLWPLVALVVFASPWGQERLARTTAWMMLLPWMFLPSSMEFNTPLVRLDKHKLSLLAIAIGVFLFGKAEPSDRASSRLVPRLAFLVLAAGALLTVLGNEDPLYYLTRVIGGLTGHDALSIVVALFLSVYLPFVVGQRVFRTRKDLVDLLDVLSLCGVIYLPLCLFEVYMSPLLHYWIYGFTPSEFFDAKRYGGFRPIVFMNHGLAVATFMFTCLCAALTLRRVRAPVEHPKAGTRSVVAGSLVILCKSLGALVFALFAAVLDLAAGPRATRWALTLVALIVLAYPTVRATKLFPTEAVIAFFTRVNAERAESLAFRLRNEDRLLERAEARPVFGWGTWGRNRVYAESGDDLSITDGDWIIRLGSFGYVGFLGFYLLLLAPVARFVLWSREMTRADQALLGGLAVMVAFLVLDLLPNSLPGFTPIVYAGALHGLSRRYRSGQRAQSSARHPLAVPGTDRAA